MASITIICPDCDKQMNAPSHVEGKKIRCKACGSTFTAHNSGTVSAEKRPSKSRGKPTGIPGKSRSKSKPRRKADPIMDMELDDDLDSLDELDDLDDVNDLDELADELAASTKDSDDDLLADDSGPPIGFADDDDDDDDDGNPYDLTNTDLSARCPHCANELEYEDAVVCLHCGYNLQTRQMGNTKKVYDTTGLDYFVWWLPGILCVLGILGLAGFNVYYLTQSHKWFDPEEFMYIVSHFGVKLWLVVFSLFASWYLGKYAFRRLVIDNQPPEVEKR